MPLYLVRWPSLVASIVRAQDEDHLRDILDEVTDPGDAVWTEYDGPLWVDVVLGLQAENEGAEWRLDGIEEAAADPLLGAAFEAVESDTSDEMFHTVLAKAFPHLYDLISNAEADASLEADEVRSAALLDLWLRPGSAELPPWLKDMSKRGGGNGAPES